jgi:hypothetical protein
MMKAFGGVVLGYLMMAAFVFLSMWLAYQIVGAERAFRPGVFRVSDLWIITSFALGFAGAVVGGYVCAAVTSNVRAPKYLAILVLIAGFAFAVPVLTNSGPSVPREGAVSNKVAMENARQPGWVALLNPLFGAIGVVIGAGMRTGKREESA